LSSLEKLYNLDQDDEPFLQSLIDNRIMESLILDYKRELPKNNMNLAKHVSSFANTNGGIIIYGIEERNHIPVNLNPLDPNLKEKIENILLTSITPKIPTKIITIDSTQESSKKYYAIYVPKSSDAPYMLISNQDNRYYKRVNFSSVPMEDYEVRLVIEKNLKSKRDILSEIENRVVLFYEDLANQEMSGEYLRLASKMDIVNLKDIDLSKFKSKEYYMNSLFINHSFVNYGKGKIIEYGLYDKNHNISNYMRNYLSINEDGLIEYARLGIMVDNPYSKAKEPNSYYILPDLMGFIYFLRDFYNELKIISEILIYIEIYNIRDTVLSSSSNIRFMGEQKHSLRDKWIDYKYIQTFELNDNYNQIVRFFADRFYENYGYSKCPNLYEEEGKLKYIFK